MIILVEIKPNYGQWLQQQSWLSTYHYLEFKAPQTNISSKNVILFFQDYCTLFIVYYIYAGQFKNQKNVMESENNPFAVESKIAKMVFKVCNHLCQHSCKYRSISIVELKKYVRVVSHFNLRCHTNCIDSLTTEFIKIPPTFVVT